MTELSRSPFNLSGEDIKWVNDTLSGMTDDEKIDAAAARILNAHRAAFEELAK